MKYKLLDTDKMKIKLVTTRPELDKIVRALERYEDDLLLRELYQTLYEAYWAAMEQDQYMFDYETLLKKYIRQVLEYSGSTFCDSDEFELADFSTEEIRMLNKLVKELE